MTTRRSVLFSLGAASLAGSPLIASPKEAWQGKDPSEWTQKEIEKVLKHSPWAKEVTAEAGGSMMTGMPSGGGRGGRRGGGGMGGGMGDSGGMPGADSSAGMGGGPMGGGGGRGMGGGDMGAQMPSRPQVRALVRWETATPVRKAAKKDLPKDVAEHYVVSLSLPHMPGLSGEGEGRPGRQGSGAPEGDPEARRKAMLQRAGAATELERKGKDPIHPEHILSGHDQNETVLFFLFPRDKQPIQLEDKEVTFVSRVGPMEVKAKFNLKDMVYDGKLEL